MKPKMDLTGQKFGRLTVIKEVKTNSKLRYWLCKCNCGNEKIVRQSSLRDGTTKSCGCLTKELLSKKSYKHGLTNSKLYWILHSMKQRCYNLNDSHSKYYGNKNIKICDEWLDKENGIINFYNWAMANGYKEGLSIDRIDSNGNYCPENCRWVDGYAQHNNTSYNKYITYNNETHTIAEWCRKLNLDYHRTVCRLLNGWSVERTFTEPVNFKQKRGKNG